VNYNASREAAEFLVAGFGASAIAVQADVSKPAGAGQLARTVRDRFGRIDAVVCNAGVTKDALLIKQREEEWDRIMAVNLGGAFHMIQACAPLMHDGGHIIVISSYSGLKGKSGQAAYSASKAALLGLMKTAARELADRNIRVNAILPGYMATDMGAAAEQAIAAAKSDSLLNTLSDPAEIASFIAYLVTTRTVTGQTFVFDSRIV
jgi:3-oxoacyl-[acyl-carrier protein] reductase